MKVLLIDLSKGIDVIDDDFCHTTYDIRHLMREREIMILIDEEFVDDFHMSVIEREFNLIARIRIVSELVEIEMLD